VSGGGERRREEDGGDKVYDVRALCGREVFESVRDYCCN